MSLEVDGETASSVIFWGSGNGADLGEGPGIVSTRFAFDGGDLVVANPVAEEAGRGFRLLVADDFSITGCGPQDDRTDLLAASFGVSFELDPVTGEVDAASCNGCA